MATIPRIPMTNPDGQEGSVPQDQVPAALAAGYKLTGTTIGAAPTFGQQALQMVKHPLDSLESASHPIPMPRDASMGEMVENDLANAAAGVAGAIRHPLDTVGGALKSGLGTIPAVENAANALVRAGGGKSPFPDAAPLVPNNPVDASRMLGLAGATAGAASFLPEAAGVAGEALSKGSSAVENYLRPKPSPLIVSKNEMAARGLAQAILPDVKDAPNFIQAASKEIPNVLDYARKTGNPLNTQLELAAAAKGSAKEVRDFYENQLLGDIAGKGVDTTGTGFGSRTGEGPSTQATLSEIDSRIGELNKFLDAPRLNVDDARKALASKADMQAEAAKLRDILHQTVADARGITPEQVADIRQRVGRSYELANDIDAAVTKRQLQVGSEAQAPQSVGRIPEQMLHDQIGGRMGIADRAMQKALKPFRDMQSSPLPQISAPAPQLPAPPRVSLAQAAGITPEPNPLAPVAVDPTSQLAAMNQALTQRGQAVTMDRAAEAELQQIQQQRLNELLNQARIRQQVAASMRKTQ